MPGRASATTGTPVVGNADKLASAVGLALDMELVISRTTLTTPLNTVRSEGTRISCWGITPVWRTLKRDERGPEEHRVFVDRFLESKHDRAIFVDFAKGRGW